MKSMIDAEMFRKAMKPIDPKTGRPALGDAKYAMIA
jgi:hypothetical protein